MLVAGIRISCVVYNINAGTDTDLRKSYIKNGHNSITSIAVTVMTSDFFFIITLIIYSSNLQVQLASYGDLFI